jgi:hypothetical protein
MILEMRWKNKRESVQAKISHRLVAVAAVSLVSVLKGIVTQFILAVRMNATNGGYGWLDSAIAFHYHSGVSHPKEA